MHSYELLAHTADIRFLLKADSLSELFHAGFEALGKTLYRKKISLSSSPIVQRIEIGSPDPTSLLIDFLSEVLTFSQMHHAVFLELFIEHCSETSFKGAIKGVKVNAFDEDIKAITYHEAQIARDQKGFFSTLIVCDI